MFAALKRRMRRFAAAPSGTRFRAHYERVKKAHPSALRTMIAIGVGMILLAAGLFTRPIALMMAIELGVIVVAIQMPNGWYWTTRGTEFAAILFVVCCAFVLGGGGRFSLDRKLGKEF